MFYKVGMISLGCDKNRVDAETLLSYLSQNGYTIVNDETIADVIIINTCGFIESAKLESIETILEMAKYKENGHCKSIIVTGCLSERYKDELLNEMPEIDGIVGLNNYKDICAIIDRTLKGESNIISANNELTEFNHSDRIITTPSHYAYLKIAEGCNNHCSYCVIPSIRGKFRSRPKEDIINEAKILADKGVKELIIVAQDTTMYGIDIYKKKALPQLLKELEDIKGIEWIRLMYCYPEEITDELIYTIKNSKKICHYLDIPIQHISNRILKLMLRRNSKEQTIELINKLRKEIPDIIIRTTLITGFPGETKEDFMELYDFLKTLKLNRVGVFSYSREEGTKAAEMENQIEESIKEQRKNTLMELQNSISLNNNKTLEGNNIDVIIESKVGKNKFYGRSYGDAPEIDQNIIIHDDNLCIGNIVKVKITKAYTYDLVGDVLNESSK